MAFGFCDFGAIARISISFAADSPQHFDNTLTKFKVVEIVRVSE